jgi:hypothetical protein
MLAGDDARIDRHGVGQIAPRTKISRLHSWQKGSTPIDPEELAGRPCYAGLDLTVKHDLTALVRLSLRRGGTVLHHPADVLDARGSPPRHLIKGNIPRDPNSENNAHGLGEYSPLLCRINSS